MDHCPDYVGFACISGTCPMALAEEYPWENAPESCNTCWRYKGCEDCIAPELGGCKKKSLDQTAV